MVVITRVGRRRGRVDTGEVRRRGRSWMMIGGVMVMVKIVMRIGRRSGRGDMELFRG